MSVYYNEINSFCCDWLRELIKRGLLPDGEIDNRSIEDVRPDELTGFKQCHFFAGIGGWPYALRLAGWPDDRQVWTGSCPCQPFSSTGKRTGFADERHLWPAFFWLIRQCKPDTIIGEQVASKDALAWWDVVYTDLEAAGYACGVCDTCAAGFGAPHIRQRLYWMADSENARSRRVVRESGESRKNDWRPFTEKFSHDSAVGVMGDANRAGLQGQPEPDRSPQGRQEPTGYIGDASDVVCGMVYANGSGRNGRLFPQASGTNGQAGQFAADGRVGIAETMPTNGFWSNPDWLWCRDKKWRPVESGLGPLVDGLPRSVVRGGDFRAIRQRLQGYGNAIVIPQAVEFIKAVMEILWVSY